MLQPSLFRVDSQRTERTEAVYLALRALVAGKAETSCHNISQLVTKVSQNHPDWGGHWRWHLDSGCCGWDMLGLLGLTGVDPLAFQVVTW